MGRSKGPDKNKDAEGKLTRAGVAANKATRQLEKAETAAANSLGGANGTGLQAGDAYAGLSANLNAAGSNQNFNQQLGQNYLDSYNTLKDQKNKSRNELAQLGNMNRQMGYNPTTGMGIGQSANFNTIGAGRDIRNLMNNPLVKMAGMATNPLGFAGSMLGKNLYQNFTDEDKNTGFLNAASKTAQDVTPFDTSSITDFLGNIFRQEEEEADYVGSDVVNTIDPTNVIETSPINKGYLGIEGVDVNSESPYGGTPSNANLLDSFDSLEDYIKSFKSDATLGDVTQPSIYGGDFNSPFNFDVSNPEIESSPSLFEQGMFPRPVETNDNINRPPGNDGGNTPVFEDNPYFDPGVVEASLPFTGYGTINPGANYNQLYGFTAANGGRVPPMSGPMSNGIGTLYKQK